MQILLQFKPEDQVSAEVWYDVGQDAFVALAFGNTENPEVKASASTIEVAVQALSVKLKWIKAGGKGSL